MQIGHRKEFQSWALALRQSDSQRANLPSDERLTLEMSAWNSLRWPIYIINSVDNIKLPSETRTLWCLLKWNTGEHFT